MTRQFFEFIFSNFQMYYWLTLVTVLLVIFVAFFGDNNWIASPYSLYLFLLVVCLLMICLLEIPVSMFFYNILLGLIHLNHYMNVMKMFYFRNSVYFSLRNLVA